MITEGQIVLFRFPQTDQTDTCWITFIADVISNNIIKEKCCH
jgi:hypothetical protein